MSRTGQLFELIIIGVLQVRQRRCALLRVADRVFALPAFATPPLPECALWQCRIPIQWGLRVVGVISVNEWRLRVERCRLPVEGRTAGVGAQTRRSGSPRRTAGSGGKLPMFRWRLDDCYWRISLKKSVEGRSHL